MKGWGRTSLIATTHLQEIQRREAHGSPALPSWLVEESLQSILSHNELEEVQRVAQTSPNDNMRIAGMKTSLRERTITYAEYQATVAKDAEYGEDANILDNITDGGEVTSGEQKKKSSHKTGISNYHFPTVHMLPLPSISLRHSSGTNSGRPSLFSPSSLAPSPGHIRKRTVGALLRSISSNPISDVQPTAHSSRNFPSVVLDEDLQGVVGAFENAHKEGSLTGSISPVALRKTTSVPTLPSSLAIAPSFRSLRSDRDASFMAIKTSGSAEAVSSTFAGVDDTHIDATDNRLREDGNGGDSYLSPLAQQLLLTSSREEEKDVDGEEERDQHRPMLSQYRSPDGRASGGSGREATPPVRSPSASFDLLRDSPLGGRWDNDLPTEALVEICEC